MPKCTIWLTNPKPPCKRSLILLHLYLPSYCPRFLLWFIPIQRNLKHRCHSSTHPHSYSLCWLCPTMGSNILLRGYSNHKPILRHSLHWPYSSRMGLRWILCRQPHLDPILHPTFPPPIHNHQLSPHPPNLPTRVRIKQPPRHPFKL